LMMFLCASFSLLLSLSSVSSHAKMRIMCGSLDCQISVKSSLARCACSCLYATREEKRCRRSWFEHRCRR
jgi:hypothetical protein